jgi:hypothetical protein
MNEWILVDTTTGNKKYADSKAEAEDRKEELGSIDGIDESDLEIRHTNGESAQADSEESDQSDTGDETPDENSVEPATPVEKPPKETETVESENDALDELGESLGIDPLSILPSHMIDTIQGKPAVNKRGYAMIAERYGIESSAEIKQFPWDNEDNRCVAKAVAKTEDGKTYSGWATASSEDGDMHDQLVELAETRALKRSISWASGVGIVSYQEMVSELE